MDLSFVSFLSLCCQVVSFHNVVHVGSLDLERSIVGADQNGVFVDYKALHNDCCGGRTDGCDSI